MEVDFDAASQPERKTGEAAGPSVANVRRADTSHYEWSCPNRPVIQNVFVGEIAVELVEDHFRTGGWNATFEVHIAILPRPAEFDQVLLVEAPPYSDTVARSGIEDEVRLLLERPDRKGDAGSITDQRSDVEAKGLDGSLLTGGLRGELIDVKQDGEDQDKPLHAPISTQPKWKSSFGTGYSGIHTDGLDL